MMISVEALFHVFMLSAAAAFTLWFFGRAWPVFCTDVFRHRCFELRERLFLIATDGRIAFDDPIYLALRSRLNSRLRLAHMDTLGSIFAIIIAFRGRVPIDNPINRKIAALDDGDLRNDLRAIYWAIVEATLRHMIVKSPIIIAVFTVIIPLALLFDVVNGGLRMQRSFWETLRQITSDNYEDSPLARGNPPSHLTG